MPGSHRLLEFLTPPKGSNSSCRPKKSLKSQLLESPTPGIGTPQGSLITTSLSRIFCFHEVQKKACVGVTSAPAATMSPCDRLTILRLSISALSPFHSRPRPDTTRGQAARRPGRQGRQVGGRVQHRWRLEAKGGEREGKAGASARSFKSSVFSCAELRSVSKVYYQYHSINIMDRKGRTSLISAKLAGKVTIRR